MKKGFSILAMNESVIILNHTKQSKFKVSYLNINGIYVDKHTIW